MVGGASAQWAGPERNGRGQSKASLNGCFSQKDLKADVVPVGVLEVQD